MFGRPKKIANYSKWRIAKELNRSVNAGSNYLNAPEDCGTKKNPGRKKKLSTKQETSGERASLVNFQPTT